MAEDELERTEVEGVLEARRELGLEYDAALIDGFAERIERVVSSRVGHELEIARQRQHSAASMGPRQLALAIISLVACIPTSIALGVNDKFGALLITLAAIVAVNLAHALQGRPR